MNQRANNIIIGILLTLAVILLITVGHYKGKVNDKPLSDTLVTVHYDTVYNTIIKVVEKPILKRVETIKYDTVYQTKDTVITLPVEKKTYNDTIVCEEDTIQLVSTIAGINPSLESIKAKLLKREIHQNTEKIITKYKVKKGFYIAPNASIGYGIFSKQPDIYLGVGIGYKF